MGRARRSSRADKQRRQLVEGSDTGDRRVVCPSRRGVASTSETTTSSRPITSAISMRRDPDGALPARHPSTHTLHTPYPTPHHPSTTSTSSKSAFSGWSYGLCSACAVKYAGLLGLCERLSRDLIGRYVHVHVFDPNWRQPLLVIALSLTRLIKIKSVTKMVHISLPPRCRPTAHDRKLKKHESYVHLMVCQVLGFCHR